MTKGTFLMVVALGRMVVACIGDTSVVVPDASTGDGGADASDASDASAGDADAIAPICDAAIGRFPSAFSVCGDAGGVICFAPDAGLCASSSTECSIEQGATIACTSSTDCPGQHCCVTASYEQQSCPWQGMTLGGSACGATCVGGAFQICQVNADCFTGACHSVANPFATEGAYGVCE